MYARFGHISIFHVAQQSPAHLYFLTYENKHRQDNDHSDLEPNVAHKLIFKDFRLELNN